MTKTRRVQSLRGQIDFAIITIREDEFEAILKRFQPRTPIIGGKQHYELCRLTNVTGYTLNVAMVRAFAQGQSVALLVARDVIDDLSPQWLILSGIAGGIPDHDFSLGDVLIASSLHDFSVTAAIEAANPQFRTSGGPVHPKVEKLIAALPAWRERLGNWNDSMHIGRDIPSTTVPDDITSDCYYGTDASRASVLSSLKCRFPDSSPPRRPLFTSGAVATSNVLLKDTQLLERWKQAAKHITHIEMEAGGVYQAARHAQPSEVPLLCVRGISDIVGFVRSNEWTGFACDTAAAFIHALLTVIPPSLYPLRLRTSLAQYVPVIGPSRLLVKTLYRVADSMGRLYSGMVAYARGDLRKSPTVEDIINAFKLSSASLYSRSLNHSERIERPELQVIKDFLASESPGVMCILGLPGCGKTTFLAGIANSAEKDGFATLGVKADLLPVDDPFSKWGDHYLGVPITALDAVRVVSLRVRVVVIVDQLDALASTVDLTSDRLNSVLAFIRECASLPNVWVVCSCRTFDYYRDARFGALDAHLTTLERPPWSDITRVLSQHGVNNAADWPESFRDILRTPQHLRIFLDSYQSTGRTEPFKSYLLMLDDLWARSVSEPEEIALLDRLTEYLILHELIWAPAFVFSGEQAAQSSLISKGILQLDGKQLGFRHQTLLEHAKARYFTRSNQSLCVHVLKHQDAVFVRPTVWAVLNYLRDAHPAKYRTELEGLFASNPRLHIRYLLIEFLGQLSDPAEWEIVLLGERLLDADDYIRVLIAIRGSPEWFRAFVDTHFPVIMAWSYDKQWPMVGVIIEAWDFAHEDCVRLIETMWLSDETKDPLTRRAMQEKGFWDDKAVGIASTLVARAERGDRMWWAESLVGAISADQPSLAPRVFVEAITKSLLEEPSGERS